MEGGEFTQAALPWPGLLEVLSSYSGRGQLYQAVAAVTGTERWTAVDVRRRARRVLFGEAIPCLSRWPTRSGDWWDALPPVIDTARRVVAAPAGRVDWSRTRLAGWPPKAGYWTRTRLRTEDEALVGTLAWTLRRLNEVREDAVAVVPGIDEVVAGPLAAARAVAARLPAGAAEERPDRAAIAAAAGSGRPWRALAAVTSILAAEDTDLAAVARRLLLPDEGARGRLFHLGCVGVALLAARGAGCTVEGLRPLGVGSGPAYRIKDGRHREWDLWVEAGGMFSYYGVPSPYVNATAHLPGVSQPLGADIALIRPGDHAVLIECKYSAEAAYVTRNGYEQALAYQAEALSGLVASADAIVVGPDGVLQGVGSAHTPLGAVRVVSVSGLEASVGSSMTEHG